MAPRKYTLDQRASSAAATRDRILTAAGELYRERGVTKTTLQAVAERADVSRGTIINHFGGADGLLGAVIDEVVGLIRIPDERTLEGLTAPEERIRRYVAEMLAFYDRSADWWPVMEPVLQSPVLQLREQAYVMALGRFQAAAFGPLARDRLVMATANGFVHWAVLGTMRAMGASLEEVIEAVQDAIVQVVNRVGERGKGGNAT